MPITKKAILEWIEKEKRTLVKNSLSKVYTESLIDFLNSLPDDNEVAKRLYLKWVNTMPEYVVEP